jgi:predicted GIY-YIG superfamily endonuclease
MNTSNKNFNFNPLVVYNDADKDKLRILKESKNKIAVYRWVNKENGKYYIGSSSNLRTRLYSYYSLKHLEKKVSIRSIERALIKYGYSSFRFEILEYCKSGKDAIVREQFYMDNSTPSYNILKLAGSTLGYKQTPEAIEKIKMFRHSPEVLKRKALSTVNATNANKIAVTVVNTKTNETVVYSSYTDAAKALEVSKSAIQQALTRKRLIKKTYTISLIIK